MREEINSVGIDIGTSTTQVVFRGKSTTDKNRFQRSDIQKSNLFHSSCKSN